MMDLRITGSTLFQLVGHTFSLEACRAIVEEMEERPGYTMVDICMMFFECDPETAHDEELEIIQELKNGKVLCWA